MTCPNCRDVEKTFDDGTAQRNLKDYRTKGPGKTTRLLLEALKSADIQGLTLLDIGGGVGVIQHELLKEGATSVIAVDASPAYLQVAQQVAARQGHKEHITYHHGDFVELAPQLPQADIVTLEKVICCYPDMEALVSLSSSRAGKFYGVVFPRDTWWMRIGGHLINLSFRLQRSAFRFFVHPTKEIEAVVRTQGFQRRFYRTTFMWQVIVYARE